VLEFQVFNNNSFLILKNINYPLGQSGCGSPGGEAKTLTPTPTGSNCAMSIYSPSGILPSPVAFGLTQYYNHLNI